MKELTVNEIQQVSGGEPAGAAAVMGMAMGVGGAVFGKAAVGITVSAAFAMSPLGVFAVLGLAFYSGYLLAS